MEVCRYSEFIVAEATHIRPAASLRSAFEYIGNPGSSIGRNDDCSVAVSTNGIAGWNLRCKYTHFLETIFEVWAGACLSNLIPRKRQTRQQVGRSTNDLAHFRTLCRIYAGVV